jgi:hypothetical protein
MPLPTATTYCTAAGYSDVIATAHPPACVLAAAAGADPWTPAALAVAPWAWYDPSDPAAVVLTAGKVSQLTDLSGNGRHATQPSALEHPLLGEINGLDCLDFGLAALARLVVPDASGLTAGALVGVIRPKDGSYAGVWRWGTSAGLQYIGLPDPWVYEDFGMTTRQVYEAPGTVYAARVYGTTAGAGQFAAYWDGELAHAAACTVAFRASVLIGQGDTPADGKVGEVVVLGYVPTAADRQKIEGYLAHKWGLAANLPADHPYKAAAPTL